MKKTHKNKSKQKLQNVRSGIRTHAYKSRLRPERSALDHSAILTCFATSKGNIFEYCDKVQVQKFIIILQLSDKQSDDNKQSDQTKAIIYLLYFTVVLSV